MPPIPLAFISGGFSGPSYDLYAWGSNNVGQLGLSDTTSRSSPVLVGSGWSTAILNVNSTAAVKTDGTLWATGWNVYGQLGLGDTTTRSSLVQVGSLTNWLSVPAGFPTITGGTTCAAIKTDGTLWTWGYGDQGQLGLNIAGGYGVRRSSPSQVGALTNWSSIASSSHVAAIKTDGTLWTWGRNFDGQLGLGTSGNYANRSSPVQVGTLSNWSFVSTGNAHTAAVKNDGTLWTWGWNQYGQLGLGNTTNRSSPVQVGALTNWLWVAAGSFHTVAIKTNGTLWAWGGNGYGQLGLGDTTDRSSPVQVGALTNWLRVSAGYTATIAIKTDGTLWTWGRNVTGELGLGDTTDRSSPVQVGALTNWITVAAGSNAMIAIAGKDVPPTPTPTRTPTPTPTPTATATPTPTPCNSCSYIGDFPTVCPNEGYCPGTISSFYYDYCNDRYLNSFCSPYTGTILFQGCDGTLYGGQYYTSFSNGYYIGSECCCGGYLDFSTGNADCCCNPC